MLRKGNNINTYGSAVTIRGKKYFIIAQNRFVKAANIAVQKASVATVATAPITEKPHPVVEKEIIHNSYLYDKQGKRANKLVILVGSSVNTANKQSINGRSFYELEDGLFISAANIDSKKIKLRRNAYIYSQHGNRISKKGLKKGKAVKTYGDPVKINNKQYYIIAKNKFVKKANFK